MPAVVSTATIPAGQSLSNAVDVTAGTLVRIRMPAQWTPANVTFQISPDNVEANFVDLWEIGGEVMIPCAPGRTVALPSEVAALREGFIKFRSGSAAQPIPQQAARDFQVVVIR